MNENHKCEYPDCKLKKVNGTVYLRRCVMTDEEVENSKKYENEKE